MFLLFYGLNWIGLKLLIPGIGNISIVSW